jgi:hypothetical protein
MTSSPDDDTTKMIQQIVISNLERYRDFGRNISLDDDVVKTLRVDSDYLSFKFIPSVEKELGVSVPQKTGSGSTLYERLVKCLRLIIGCGYPGDPGLCGELNCVVSLMEPNAELARWRLCAAPLRSGQGLSRCKPRLNYAYTNEMVPYRHDGCWVPLS